MIEKKAYIQEKVELSKSRSIIPNQVKDKSLIEQISQLLIKFSNYAPSKMKGTAMPRYFERELIGMLDAYIDAADEQIKVITNTKFLLENTNYMQIFWLEKVKVHY